MDNKNQKIMDGLNKILKVLGPHGGIITIEDDWKFRLAVNDLGAGELEMEIASINDDIEDSVLCDPQFRIDVEFDEGREKVVSAKPTCYLSQWWGGKMHIDQNDNIHDSEGNASKNDGELTDRLCSYLDTITEIQPYLTGPASVARFEKDVDWRIMEEDPHRRKLWREAISRMRLLGVDSEDITRFARGELTKIFVDHAKRKVQQEALTQDELALVRKAEQENSIPFAAYYVISDTVVWPDGETNTRYILPCVWDETYDWDDVSEYKEGELWGNVRKGIINYKSIPCFIINQDIPEYSEFGELPYQMLNGMLFTVG